MPDPNDVRLFRDIARCNTTRVLLYDSLLKKIAILGSYLIFFTNMTYNII